MTSLRLRSDEGEMEKAGGGKWRKRRHESRAVARGHYEQQDNIAMIGAE